MLFTIKSFGGMAPRIDPRLLPDENAQVAVGTKLRSGALVPFMSPSVIKGIPDPQDTYRTLYQYEHTASDIFLTFENDVDIVKGPVANDQYNRTYITGLDVPRAFDTTLLADTDTTVTSSNSYTLAVPTGSAATLSKSGTGTGELVSRAYVYTYIREWSDSKIDEGMPTTAALNGSDEFIDVQVGETVTIADIEDAPNQAQNGVDRIAIYRTAVGTSGAEYQLVLDFNITDAKAGSVSGVTWSAGSSTFSYDDTKLDEALGEVLQSTTWEAPSDNLKGLVSLRNGSLVAFEDNVLHFSEPYQMHAWPVEYRVTMDYNIIGLGAFGNTVVVMTDQFPFLANAQDPSVVIPQPTQSSAPCLSKRGIVNYENTVYYPSSDGLMALSSSGIKNVSQGLFTHDEWFQYHPATFESAIQDGRYFAFYEDDETGSTGFLIVDLEEALAAASTEVFGASAFYVNKKTDTLYFIQQDSRAGWLINEWEGLMSNRTLIWKTKKFTTSEGPANLAGCRIRARYLTQAELDALNAELEKLAEQQSGDLDGAVNEVEYNLSTFNGDILEAIRANYRFAPKVVARFYVDDILIHTQDVLSGAPFRLPAGIVGTWFEIEVESNLPIYQIDMATSMRELR